MNKLTERLAELEAEIAELESLLAVTPPSARSYAIAHLQLSTAKRTAERYRQAVQPAWVWVDCFACHGRGDSDCLDCSGSGSVKSPESAV